MKQNNLIVTIKDAITSNYIMEFRDFIIANYPNLLTKELVQEMKEELDKLLKIMNKE